MHVIKTLVCCLRDHSHFSRMNMGCVWDAVSSRDVPGTQVPQSGQPAHEGVSFALLFSFWPEDSERVREACWCQSLGMESRNASSRRDRNHSHHLYKELLILTSVLLLMTRVLFRSCRSHRTGRPGLRIQGLHKEFVKVLISRFHGIKEESVLLRKPLGLTNYKRLEK